MYGDIADLGSGNAVTAGLTAANVAAVRLYSTAAFRALNDPLRDRARTAPHSPSRSKRLSEVTVHGTSRQRKLDTVPSGAGSLPLTGTWKTPCTASLFRKSLMSWSDMYAL